MDLRLIHSAMIKRAGGTPVKTGSLAASTPAVPGSYEPGRQRPFISDITRKAPVMGDDLNKIKRPLLHRINDFGNSVADSITDWTIDKAKFIRDRGREFPKAAPELIKNPGLAGKSIVKGFSQTGNELVQGLDSLSKIPYSIGDAIGTTIQEKYPKFTDVVSTALYPVGWLSNKKDAIHEAHPWTRYLTTAPVLDPFSYDKPLVAQGADWLNDKAQYSNAMDTTGLSREADILGRTTGGVVNLATQALIPELGVPASVYKKGVTPWAFLSAMGKDMGINAAFENKDEFAGANRADSDRRAVAALNEVAKERAEAAYQQQLFDQRNRFNNDAYLDDKNKQEAFQWASSYLGKELGAAVMDGRITPVEYKELIQDPDLIQWIAEQGALQANAFEPGKPRQGWDYASDWMRGKQFGERYEEFLDAMDAREQQALDYSTNPANWDDRTIREMADQFIKEMKATDLPEMKRYTYNYQE